MSSAAAGRSSRTTRPASLLRWDVPAALFAGGRCTSPVAEELSYHSRHLHNNQTTLVRDGFFGHNVSQTGVGWILGELPTYRHGASFGHDAWEFAPSRINPPAGRQCTAYSDHGATYAEARLNATRPVDRNVSSWNELQAAATRYKAFVSSRWNCVHGDWEGALADQRSYASLVAAEYAASSSQFSTPSTAECSLYGSLYNQVHASWNRSHIRAIFYVNDTHTPAIYAKRHRSTKGLQSMKSSALAAALRALALARLAQHIIESVDRITLPIVQYVHTEECYLAAPLMARQQARDVHPAKFAASARGIFRAMPVPG